MGKITKKKFKKHFKGVCKKAGKKKTLGTKIDEHVKSIVIEELEAHGDDGMEKIVIDNVSIEILSERPEIMASSVNPESVASSVNLESKAAASVASTRCMYYCYVIRGRTICQEICW